MCPAYWLGAGATPRHTRHRGEPTVRPPRGHSACPGPEASAHSVGNPPVRGLLARLLAVSAEAVVGRPWVEPQDLPLLVDPEGERGHRRADEEPVEGGGGHGAARRERRARGAPDLWLWGWRLRPEGRDSRAGGRSHRRGQDCSPPPPCVSALPQAPAPRGARRIWVCVRAGSGGAEPSALQQGLGLNWGTGLSAPTHLHLRSARQRKRAPCRGDRLPCSPLHVCPADLRVTCGPHTADTPTCHSQMGLYLAWLRILKTGKLTPSTLIVHFT